MVYCLFAYGRHKESLDLGCVVFLEFGMSVLSFDFRLRVYGISDFFLLLRNF